MRRKNFDLTFQGTGHGARARLQLSLNVPAVARAR